MPSHRKNFVEDLVRAVEKWATSSTPLTNLRPGDRQRHSKDNSCAVELHCCNLVLVIALYKNFPQMFLCPRNSDLRVRDGMGHVCMSRFVSHNKRNEFLANKRNLRNVGGRQHLWLWVLTLLMYKLLLEMQKSCSDIFIFSYTLNGNVNSKLKKTEKWVTITSNDDIFNHRNGVDPKQVGCEKTNQVVTPPNHCLLANEYWKCVLFACNYDSRMIIKTWLLTSNCQKKTIHVSATLLPVECFCCD